MLEWADKLIKLFPYLWQVRSQVLSFVPPTSNQTDSFLPYTILLYYGTAHSSLHAYPDPPSRLPNKQLRLRLLIVLLGFAMLIELRSAPVTPIIQWIYIRVMTKAISFICCMNTNFISFIVRHNSLSKTLTLWQLCWNTSEEYGFVKPGVR